MGSRDNVSLLMHLHKSLFHRYFVIESERPVRHSVPAQIDAHSHVNRFFVT